MGKLSTTELEFKGQIQGWINEILSHGQFPFESAGSESSLQIDETRKFPDLVLWLDRMAMRAFASWEMKGPEINADNPDLVQDALQKARALAAKYFITFNLREALLWKVPSTALEDSPLTQQKTWRPKCNISSREDFQAKSTQAHLKEMLHELIYDLVKLYQDETLFEIEPDVFFVNRITEAAHQIFPFLHGTLFNRYARDRRFKEELNQWATTQGIPNFGDEASLQIIARQMTYRLLGKVLFYQALTRYRADLPRLEIIKTKDFSQKLQEYFAQALRIDYQAIFEQDLPDKIVLPETTRAPLESLIEDLKRYDFSQLPQEIIGSIFEKIIPPEERHRLGQYFTSENLVDLILAFAVRSASDYVLDPTCGSGTFLIRAYDRFKSKGIFSHKELLKRLWGIDIAPFPSELATINLYRQNLSDYENFPRLIVEDFFNVNPELEFKFPPPKPSDDPQYQIIEKMPLFDAAVGNFPYIRQELIEKANPGYEAKLERIIAQDWRADYPPLFKKGNSSRLSGRADIYSYMFLHTARFLKPDGRMGFVTANIWIDADFGYELQRFFLEKFKIIAILESRCEPWFENAAINTIVTILERCAHEAQRNEHYVKFVKIKRPLREIVSWDIKLEPHQRWSGLDQLVKKIESAEIISKPLSENVLSHEDENFRIRLIKQKDLVNDLRDFGGTIKWGKYLRAPDVYFDIIANCQHLIPLKDLAAIRFGIKTGINDFFYPPQSRAKQFAIEKEFLIPVLKSPKQFDSIMINPSKLDIKCFICPKTKEELRKGGKSGALKYIQWGEKQKTKEGVAWPKVPSVQNRRKGWWAVPDAETSQIFWSKAHDIRLLHRWSPKPIFADCRVYFVECNNSSITKKVAAILNSTLSLLFLELIGRVSLGEGALDVMVEDAKDYMIVPNPELIDPKLLKSFEQMASREIKPIFEEVRMLDRRKLDTAILKSIGLDPKKYLDPIYSAICELVQERISIAKKRKNMSNSRVRRDVEKLKIEVSDHFLPLLTKHFPDAFIDAKYLKQPEAMEIAVSNQPLKLGRPFMMFHPVVADDGFEHEAKSREEAKFIIYSQKPDSLIVKIPKRNIIMEKAIHDFELHLKSLSQQLFTAIYERVGDHKFAERLVEEIMIEHNLKKI